MKVRVAKKHSALGLHCLFHVRTSGDIKGLLRGLSLCISSAPTVCAQDPGMRSVFHLITPRLKALGGREAALSPHLPAVFFARAYVCGLFKNCQHPPPPLSLSPPLWRVDAKPHKYSASRTYVTRTESEPSQCTAELLLLQHVLNGEVNLQLNASQFVEMSYKPYFNFTKFYLVRGK